MVVVSLALSRWRMYRRCCFWVWVELELRLRSGHEGLLAVTITHHTRYIEIIVNEYWMHKEGEISGGQ
jgi:hypothetical protein